MVSDGRIRIKQGNFDSPAALEPSTNKPLNELVPHLRHQLVLLVGHEHEVVPVVEGVEYFLA